jgi:putative oxidoreductase
LACARLIKTAQEAPLQSIYTSASRYQPIVLSILRIVAGLLFVEHGTSKLFGFPDAGPPLQGLILVAALLEGIGGLFIIFGVFTRIAAFILSGEMAFAYFMAHAPQGLSPLVNHGEGAVLYCFIFLYLAFAGGGAWSVDRAVLKQE